ncbi:hypothetical protein NP233_g10796 [Leucocoprinus birnbaumii]|uniref:Uncharacterized protein n=1 Tax=Leucocoprinus birnbaumii TaxID=56174 RepID=A0AAD5YL00_9AGAR|nr:hypothetical protein NP233_g10796 [Leucocoprinus birnbaumii]
MPFTRSNPPGPRKPRVLFHGMHFLAKEGERLIRDVECQRKSDGSGHHAVVESVMGGLQTPIHDVTVVLGDRETGRFHRLQVFFKNNVRLDINKALPHGRVWRGDILVMHKKEVRHALYTDVEDTAEEMRCVLRAIRVVLDAAERRGLSRVPQEIWA